MQIKAKFCSHSQIKSTNTQCVCNHKNLIKTFTGGCLKPHESRPPLPVRSAALSSKSFSSTLSSPLSSSSPPSLSSSSSSSSLSCQPKKEAHSGLPGSPQIYISTLNLPEYSPFKVFARRKGKNLPRTNSFVKICPASFNNKGKHKKMSHKYVKKI